MTDLLSSGRKTKSKGFTQTVFIHFFTQDTTDGNDTNDSNANQRASSVKPTYKWKIEYVTNVRKLFFALVNIVSRYPLTLECTSAINIHPIALFKSRRRHSQVDFTKNDILNVIDQGIKQFESKILLNKEHSENLTETESRSKINAPHDKELEKHYAIDFPSPDTVIFRSKKRGDDNVVIKILGFIFFLFIIPFAGAWLIGFIELTTGIPIFSMLSGEKGVELLPYSFFSLILVLILSFFFYFSVVMTFGKQEITFDKKQITYKITFGNLPFYTVKIPLKAVTSFEISSSKLDLQLIGGSSLVLWRGNRTTPALQAANELRQIFSQIYK